MMTKKKRIKTPRSPKRPRVTKKVIEERKKRRYTKMNELVRRRRAELIELKGNKCLDCRIAYSYHMYDFHHKNPATKKFTLTGKNLTRKWDTVLAELKKCVLLCPNCHRKRHFELSQKAGKEY